MNFDDVDLFDLVTLVREKYNLTLADAVMLAYETGCNQVRKEKEINDISEVRKILKIGLSKLLSE